MDFTAEGQRLALISIFRRDEAGRRPVYGGMATFQHDPHWRDLLLFHECFHGDNGAGIGASHQTGWTGAVARLIQLFGSTGPAEMLHRPPLPLANAYRPPGPPPPPPPVLPATVPVRPGPPPSYGRRDVRHERPEARHDRCQVKRSRDDVLPAGTGPGRPRGHTRAG
jgi:hypothetical protein